ncbi:MAG: hypothetical protein ACLSB9_22765 [Hydrogeniiclostridium mannosilyticum]
MSAGCPDGESWWANRLLMQSYSIEPLGGLRGTYRMGGRQLLYLAADGELVAMFLISYISDRRRAAELHRMEDNGLSLIVRTCDPSITPAFLAGCFQLDESSIAVLPDSPARLYEGITAEPDGRADALMPPRTPHRYDADDHRLCPPARQYLHCRGTAGDCRGAGLPAGCLSHLLFGPAAPDDPLPGALRGALVHCDSGAAAPAQALISSRGLLPYARDSRQARRGAQTAWRGWISERIFPCKRAEGRRVKLQP